MSSTAIVVQDQEPRREASLLTVPGDIGALDPSHPPVVVDEFGLLRVGDEWVALSDIEWRLIVILVNAFGRSVPRDDLVRAGWEDVETGERSLSQRMCLARRRVEPLGLSVFTIRGRGYVLDWSTHAPLTSRKPLR